MPWCPACGAEYREGFTRCPHCHRELVNQPPSQQPKVLPEQQWALLTTSASNEETQLVRGVLTGEKIPFVAKDRGDGSLNRLYTGSSFYGVDFYVEASWLEEAQQLMEACFTPLDEEALRQIAQDQALFAEEPAEAKTQERAVEEEPPDEAADGGGRKYAALITLLAMVLLILLLRFR